MSLLSVRHPASLAAAALVGLLVSLALLFIVSRSAAVKTTPVLVAAQDVPAGVALTKEMLKVVDWPAHLKGFSAIASPKEAVGRVTHVALISGEPVMSAKLWAAGERGYIEDRLVSGERALSVSVNEMIGIDPATLPGNFIDLIITPRGEAATAASSPVAERLRVLAVNRSADPARPQPIRQLTLAVTPEQARSIESARAQGTLTALLRNAQDVLCTAPSVAQFPENTRPQAKSATRAAQRPIEIILGAEKVTP